MESDAASGTDDASACVCVKISQRYYLSLATGTLRRLLRPPATSFRSSFGPRFLAAASAPDASDLAFLSFGAAAAPPAWTHCK